MSVTEVAIQGTLNPDGTLVLDEKPALPPGRVRVVLRPEEASKTPPEDWWQYMQRSRRELEAQSAFMNEAEVAAHLEWLRQGDPIDELLHRGKPNGC